MTPTAADVPATGEPRLAGVFRIDRDGTWLHEGVEVTHPGVLQNLYANLRTEGEAYHLQVGPQRIPVQVDDAPFVVVRADAMPAAETVTLHLTDGSREALDAATLVLDARGIPHCRVKDGRFPARFSIAAWLQLAGQIAPESGSGEPALVLGGRRITLRRPA